MAKTLQLSLLALILPALVACETGNLEFSAPKAPVSTGLGSQAPNPLGDAKPADEEAPPSVTPPEETASAKRFRLVNEVMAQHCFKCHAAGSRGGDLKTVTEESFVERKSRKTGRFFVVPGKPMESDMYMRLKGIIANGDMPGRPENRALNEEEAALIKDWIEQFDQP